MRVSSLNVFISVALLALPAMAYAKAPPIDRVVVFGDRAQVTRTADVTCQGGSASVEFFPLPQSLDERTVRAEASGKATAVGTTLATRALEADRDARARAAWDELRVIRDQIAALNARQKRLDARRAALGGLSDHALRVLTEQMRDPKRDLGRWTDTFERWRTEQERIATAGHALKIEQRAARRTEAERAKRVALLDPKQALRGRAVTVAVDCRGASRTTVKLAYVVPGATWRPEYDLRATPKAEGASTGPADVEWVTSAVIRQSTGEDWTNAQIVLSSARPWLGVSAPEPRMLKLYARKAGAQKRVVTGRERRVRLSAGKARADQASAATVADAGVAVTLTLPKRVSIRADGRPYWVPIDSKRAAAELALVALPGRAAAIWQVARLKNPMGYPLLAGTLHAYRRGAYMGDDLLAHHGPGAPIEASLGVDAQLRLERAPITEKRALEGIFGGLLGQEHVITNAYEIVLRNGRSTAARIEVREQIPVSKNAAIKVKLRANGTTAGYTLDAEQGHVQWIIDVPPGGEKRLSFAYTVRVPGDWKVRN